MRELKFRIWDEEKNEWLCESDDDALTYYGFSLLGGCMLVQSPRKWTVKGVIEQYTGLKDKNGKEIYEGDIIDFFGEKYLVVYRAGGFWAEYNKMQRDHLFLYATESEVIGNIHEKPELLKGEE